RPPREGAVARGGGPEHEPAGDAVRPRAGRPLRGRRRARGRRALERARGRPPPGRADLRARALPARARLSRGRAGRRGEAGRPRGARRGHSRARGRADRRGARDLPDARRAPRRPRAPGVAAGPREVNGRGARGARARRGDACRVRLAQPDVDPRDVGPDPAVLKRRRGRRPRRGGVPAGRWPGGPRGARQFEITWIESVPWMQEPLSSSRTASRVSSVAPTSSAPALLSDGIENWQIRSSRPSPSTSWIATCDGETPAIRMSASRKAVASNSAVERMATGSLPFPLRLIGFVELFGLTTME